MIKSFRACDIFKNYRLKGEIMRHAAPIDFANHTESDLQDQCFCDHFPPYLWPINRISQNEFNGKRSSNWGVADTYDHIRRMAPSENHNGRNGRATPIEHSRGEIDQVNMSTALLAIKMSAVIIGIIMMTNMIIRTIMGISQMGKRY